MKLIKNDILEKACQLFNMDETGMSLNPKRPNILSFYRFSSLRKHSIQKTCNKRFRCRLVWILHYYRIYFCKLLDIVGCHAGQWQERREKGMCVLLYCVILDMTRT